MSSSVARGCGFDQLVVAIGGAADEVRRSGRPERCGRRRNEAYGEGCSSSIAAALGRVDARCDVLVLLLGDQPGVTPATAVAPWSPAAARRRWRSAGYDDGPRASDRVRPRDLRRAGRRCTATAAVWKLLDRPRRTTSREVPIAGPIPLDVDTEDDYRAVLAAAVGGA